MALLLPPSFFLFMPFVVFLLWGSVPDSVHGGNETDRLALLAFKAEITGDPLGILNFWNESIHFCQWVGVTCGRRHQRVTELILLDGKLSGPISPHIGNLSFLMRLRLQNNSLNHDIPQELGRLRRLKFMSLYNNLVTGEIPANISRCSNLISLEFTLNRLTGKIPTELGRLSKLQRLYIAKTNLTGGVPATIGNLSSLTILYISENNFGGNIPDDLGRLTNLKTFAVSVNRLVGTIPSSIFNLSSITEFDIAKNQIQGILPTNLGTSLSNLEFLGVAGNLLTGSIPSSISNATNLYNLGVNTNNFTGKMPSLDKLRNLQRLVASYNHLGTGEADDLSFLSPLINATNLEWLELADNGFGGVFPEVITNFSIGLSYVNLYDNMMNGSIPRGIVNLVNLQLFAIGNNYLTAAISIEGNKKLCGGIPDLQLRSCQSKGFPRKKFAQVVKVLLPSSFGLVCLFVMMYFVHLRWFKKRTEVPSFNFFGHSFAKLSYGSLVKATNGFSPTNLIGMGSFGSVYKGILDLDHGEKLVAVKVLNLQFRGAAKSFIAECKALRSIRHRNLVNVITACSSVDYKGDDFKALVYEFMVNGSLEEWLHPNEKEDDAHNKSQSLNLLQRLNIAFDVASALFYLHHHCLEPIVHCDLKPSNVLLDDDMVGHVGDFGLARFLVDRTRISSANQSSSIGLRGSSGYAAPEYGMGNQVSTTGDMYSFGILLLEMVTGKRPTDTMFTGSLTLHNFVEMAMAEQVANIVDPTLFQQVVMGEASSSNSSQNQSPASFHEVQECLTSILKVGIACSKELPRDRPDIKETVTQLHVIKKTILGVGVHGRMRARIAA
ncbi:probable LRR receptor-like serine/threonine-protein kinase At3g47570 isoform X3 [Rhododendron vialii]|uniref:probable LRR receptor-like serine/threonine-protein kinase At3g47570 isoform X3 n=1 Tax=Rhododendron vialii TaxID=182163 RepID=UPI00265FCFC2|nr:probable LRR receptor-like serine/threonine-protein kinase At3g47570 isoform X3 [Rhododendron vialii]